MLRHKGYDELVLTYKPRATTARESARESLLLPGYVFCRVMERSAGPIVTTPGVIRLVGNGNRPEAVSDEEIERLKSMVASGLPLAPWGRIEPGDVVTLADGPLRGCEGVFKRLHGEGLLIVAVTLLQRSIAVTVRQEWVKPMRRDPLHPEAPAAPAFDGEAHAPPSAGSRRSPALASHGVIGVAV